MLSWLAITGIAAFLLVKLIGLALGLRESARQVGTTTPGAGSRALAIRDVGWSVLAGVVGSVVSISAGMGAAAATMDPAQGATFIAIWFWLAGPPVSAVAMALVVRLRQWDPPTVGVHAVVAFTVCFLCGLVALQAASPRSSTPPNLYRPQAPQTTDLEPHRPARPDATPEAGAG